MGLDNLTKPGDCNSKEEIRKQIDAIDFEIVKLFAQRYEYVKEIVYHKEKCKDAIVAQDRKDLVIKQRGEWAANLGLDGDVYADFFKQLIEHNISKELEILQKKL